ncbi:hypothetical protein DesLBE_0541 [Desulfitobacterium sp. LBE]|uniref:DUF2007 domain protein n=3 Tax=root TaxID=1 RepID=A0A098B011_DESHA|nr:MULTISPECIES: hypothetical protein [Desulfitobacterium]ACL20837.1 conserved hypothetical protein [Desulfitobacterium hafniense DCB-2]MEA5025762.1 hypothetical protein [Desulfitobacterium hafniense]TWH56339.1 hypothetical protein DesLBE_0541 [Desulfitobacterium sp. LBE]CDX01722.1 DUF2007 domain protein [Desulfitobacterium hafniense]
MNRWVFLTNVTTEVEADIVIGLLEQGHIPAQKAYPGLGNLKAAYGIVNGVEIYVPEDCLKHAKEILAAEGAENAPDEAPDPDVECDR